MIFLLLLSVFHTFKEFFSLHQINFQCLILKNLIHYWNRKTFNKTNLNLYFGWVENLIFVFFEVLACLFSVDYSSF